MEQDKASSNSLFLLLESVVAAASEQDILLNGGGAAFKERKCLFKRGEQNRVFWKKRVLPFPTHEMRVCKKSLRRDGVFWFRDEANPSVRDLSRSMWGGRKGGREREGEKESDRLYIFFPPRVRRKIFD